MDQTASVAFQVAAGIGLAACAGLRAFLPLFLVSAAARMGWAEPAAPFQWLSTWPALITLGWPWWWRSSRTRSPSWTTRWT
jgi:hypothetical protein